MVIAVLAFEVAGMLTVSDEARIYARETSGLSGESAATLDIENTPGLALALDWPTTAISLAYAPRFLWTDVVGDEPSPTLILHTGALGLTWEKPRYRLALAQTLSIGDQSFARLSGTSTLESEPSAIPTAGETPSPQLELLPGPTVVRVRSAQSSASLRYEWTRRVGTELRSSFAISGGADERAQVSMPRQQTTGVEGMIDVRASLRDVLGTTLGLAQTSTSNGYDHRSASLMQTWSRGFAAQSGGELGAGVALQDTTGPLGSTSTELGPIATASLWHTLLLRAMQMRLRSELGYRPHLNVLTGTLQRRLFASAEASMTKGDTGARLALGATQTFPSDAPDSAQAISLDLGLEQVVLDELSAELGGQIVWQGLGDRSAFASGSSRWLLYAGVRGELPVARF